MRYEEQGHELAIEWPPEEEFDLLARKFSEAHKALYGFDLPDVAIEIVTLRVEASGLLPAPVPEKAGQGNLQTAQIGTQLMILNGREVPVPVFDRRRLGVGSEVNGPAIITQLDTTILVEQKWKLSVHVSGAIILELI